MGMPIYRPCMANNPAGTKLGAASHPPILSLQVVPIKGGRSLTQQIRDLKSDPRGDLQHIKDLIRAGRPQK